MMMLSGDGGGAVTVHDVAEGVHGDDPQESVYQPTQGGATDSRGFALHDSDHILVATCRPMGP
jgi:hypothetical protein